MDTVPWEPAPASALQPLAIAAADSNRRRALVIEDNREIASLLTPHLRRIGCEPQCVADGAVGLRLACDSTHWALLILDLQLPRVDGIEICRAARLHGLRAPIMIVSARSTERELVVGLASGADDYLTKPFSMIEFAARASALLRHSARLTAASAPKPHALRCGALCLDLEQRLVRCGHRILDLTAREFELLAFFMRSPGRVYTRTQLLDQVWGSQHVAFEHTVNSHINRLRAKLGADVGAQFIQTVWGVGYRLAAPGESTLS